ncbi:MAG: type II toxin-antitoxin system HicB family antitoxin [Methanoculleus sp.]|nr:type II toxin-antitoxin system HicB family antitoxin [Methanoculleus sp.]
MKVNCLIEKDEDGYYYASVPSLPGCFTQAKTYEELIIRLDEAISPPRLMSKQNSTFRKNSPGLYRYPSLLVDGNFPSSIFRNAAHAPSSSTL